MSDFSLADALGDDTPKEAKKIGNTNPSAPPASNPAGLVRPRELPHSPQPLVRAHTLVLLTLAQALPQARTPASPLLPGDSLLNQGRERLGSSLPELQDSSRLVQERRGRPGAPAGPYPNVPFPGAQPGAPGAFPPGPGAFPPFPSGGFPPIPPARGAPLLVGASLLAPAPFGSPGSYGGPMMVPFDLPLHAGIMPRLVITIVGEPVPGAESMSLNLKILVDEDMFKVAVDGVHMLEYEHRVGGLEEVTLLRIMGDVVLYSASPSMI
ncbi:hypothetical protein WMY93_017762 [Mugilogobius chulae]|uniref:Galectin domain-containing protein n=1 Tax=Mugilogobius chulae TaxID=88201 RepID=A0AAW0NZC0_9GOBI